ncbi:MAG: hypothetical protein E4G91_10190 [Candidatus Zixiibacteriota bacterium]|nr:MAG: hypothetical protein E4G91_10190 [candidate division Zixibacteria bacterium]
MARRLSMLLPALFVLVFAFCLVVSMQTPAVAGPPACCQVVNVCDGYIIHGECPRIDGICKCYLVVSYCDGAPAPCPIPPR